MFWILWVLAGVALAVWLLPEVGPLVTGWRFWRLADFPPPEDGPLPRLSVVVAARDEAETIEPAMRSLVAADYPDLEVIAVDDRSTDATGAILDRLASAGPPLRVVHVRELPPGWLGKNYALHVGSLQASGEYMLFTDADVHFKPDALSRAVRYARANKIDHLAVLPDLAMGGFWELLAVSFFGFMYFIYTQPWRLANPRSGAHVGIGAFNLVKAEVYRRAGGYASLPMDTGDDVKLGKRMKQAGARCGFVDGAGLLSVRWVVGLCGVVRGLEKNMFGGFSYSALRAVVAMAGLLIVATWPAIGVFTGPLGPRLACAGALLLMLLRSWRYHSGPAWTRVLGLGFPLAGPIFAYIVLRSMMITYRQGGIVWRGTLYPLGELRKGVV
ncbi:MAG: glycosyltransferase [Planctomycetes bacterium]|nr:glycosyltransferase [Planctomycetota bacterium]